MMYILVFAMMTGPHAEQTYRLSVENVDRWESLEACAQMARSIRSKVVTAMLEAKIIGRFKLVCVVIEPETDV